MLRTKGFSAIAVIVAGVATRTNAMESHHTTEKAWQEYVRGAATRIQPVPNGLIHDWIGAVFTPNATIDGLVSVVRDYGRYKDYLPTGGHGFPVARFRNSRAGVFHGVHGHVLFVNVARRGRYRAHGVIINSHRGYSIVEVITLQQIEDYGRPGEHLLPPDTGGGFICEDLQRFAVRRAGRRRVPGDRSHRSEPRYPEFCEVVGESGGEPSGGGLDVKHSWADR